MDEIIILTPGSDNSTLDSAITVTDVGEVVQFLQIVFKTAATSCFPPSQTSHKKWVCILTAAVCTVFNVKVIIFSNSADELKSQ